MTTLDAVARRSAIAVEAAVRDCPIPPIGGSPMAVRLEQLRQAFGYALAGAVGVLLAVVALIAVVQPSEDVAETPTTTPPPTVVEQTVPSTAPEIAPEIVDTAPPSPPVVPIGGGETDSPPAASAAAPWLRIVSPDSGVTVTTRAVEVVGMTDPGARVWGPDGAEVPVGSDGAWSHLVELNEGRNRLAYTATNDSDVAASAFIVVELAPPPTTTTTRPKTTTTTTEAPRWEFTAHATYGSCEEDPPYDVHYGTGKPGTLITITSEHGGGSVEVAANGEWSVTVFFPEAPLNEAFAVKVQDFTGAKKIFEFVHTG